MRNIIKTIALAGLAFMAITGCNNSGNSPTDTPTSGKLNISVDESFASIIDSHVYTFNKLYKYADVSASYKPEGAVVQDLLNDSARVVVLSRELTPEENKVFEQLKIRPRVTKVAIDGVALILNKQNTDTLLALTQLKSLFTGKVDSWKQLNPKSDLDDITIVFDNSNSGTARYVIDSINGSQPLPKAAFSAKSNKALVDYVAKTPGAIGVLGVNAISDFDDSTAIGFLKQINVVAVGRKENLSDPDSYYKPFQGYLADGTYPLKRNLYVISREARAGLGTGFASFVAGDKGQRIFLKSGLVPATMPVRLISITE